MSDSMYYSWGGLGAKNGEPSPRELYLEATGRGRGGTPLTGARRMSEAEARETVRKVYLEVLHREPDYPGALGYVNGLIEGRFGPDFVRAELAASTEYGQRFPTAVTTVAPGAPGLAPSGPGVLSSLGEYWPILAAAGVGLVLLMVLGGKR